MTQCRLTFGAVAEAYEQFRPGYPDAVADVVLDYAPRTVRSAFEIGAGTGKATRAFARRAAAGAVLTGQCVRFNAGLDVDNGVTDEHHDCYG